MGTLRKHLRSRRAVGIAVLHLCVLGCTSIPLWSAEPTNLALNKPASSSSIENDEHSAAKANDGDPNTSWCADDEPEGGPEWWQVDLMKPFDLTGCQIRWPYDGKKYRYKVEGSIDQKKLVALERSDQRPLPRRRSTTSSSQGKSGPLREDHRDRF